MQLEILPAGNCTVRDGDRLVMAIMPKYILKRAQSGVCGGEKSVVDEVALGSEYHW